MHEKEHNIKAIWNSQKWYKMWSLQSLNIMPKSIFQAQKRIIKPWDEIFLSLLMFLYNFLFSHLLSLSIVSISFHLLNYENENQEKMNVFGCHKLHIFIADIFLYFSLLVSVVVVYVVIVAVDFFSSPFIIFVVFSFSYPFFFLFISTLHLLVRFLCSHSKCYGYSIKSLWFTFCLHITTDSAVIRSLDSS